MNDKFYDEELKWGPVIVTKGKYKGRIGCYDDDEGSYAYVYWGIWFIH